MNFVDRRKKALALSVAAAVLLLVCAWWIDRSLPTITKERSTPIEEVVAPAPLTESELAAARGGQSSATGVQLDRGAWVQVADKSGRVAQQYTAERLDPQAGAFLSMVEPRAVFYFDDGRVATLRADTGRVHVPSRALESGTFRGTVVIRVYRPATGFEVNLATDAPSMILESEELDFDQLQGQIGCRSSFRLTTEMLTFDGEGLDLLLGNDGKSIERLTVDRPLGPIVIDRSKQASATSARRNALAARTPWSAVDRGGAILPAKNAVAASAVEADRFYKLELHDDVEVLRYTPQDRAWTKGDLLVAIFTLKSDLVAKQVASADFISEPKLDESHSRFMPPMSVPSHIVAALLAAQAEPQSADGANDLIVIRYSGALRMEPVEPGETVPSSPKGMLVNIDGKSAELANSAGMALRGHEVDIELAADGSGRTTPRSLVAVGAVEATDLAQTLWCENLRAQFESVEDPAAAKSKLSDPALGPAEVSRVTAVDGVQIQLKDGARVFSQSLVAYPPKGLAELAGSDIAVVRSGVLIDSIAAITVDDRKRTAVAPSGGHARSWKAPIVAPELRGKIERPSVPSSKPELDATWKGEMTYTDHAQLGAVLELDQSVRLRAEPRPEEFDALDAQHVHLELDRRVSAAGALADAVAASAPTSTGGEIKPRRLIATGDARIENQVWLDAQRTGEPRLFQVRGAKIEYDAVTGEASVPCAGQVLVNIPKGHGSESSAKARPDSQAISGAGVEGVSRFRWELAMNLKRLVDGKYLMTMDEGVELLRAGIEQSETMSLTCDRLEATLQRRDQESASSDAGGEFNLGGSSELQRVRGIGRCFIRTPEYDVECEEFDYNTVTGMAEMRSRAGRLVTVLAKGQGTPLRAAEMTWDMQSGRIQIRSGSGSVGK